MRSISIVIAAALIASLVDQVSAQQMVQPPIETEIFGIKLGKPIDPEANRCTEVEIVNKGLFSSEKRYRYDLPSGKLFCFWQALPASFLAARDLDTKVQAGMQGGNWDPVVTVATGSNIVLRITQDLTLPGEGQEKIDALINKFGKPTSAQNGRYVSRFEWQLPGGARASLFSDGSGSKGTVSFESAEYLKILSAPRTAGRPL